MPRPVQTDSTPVTELFFALIRCGIGKEDRLPATPTPQEWQELFDIAKKQTLAGIAFAGIETIPKEQRPPKEILLPWYHLSQVIRKKNAELNSKSAAVSEKFRHEGFPNCILKGQGIAQLYPDPYLRTPGDIDIWLDGGDDKILPYVKKYFPQCEPTYHHVDFPISGELDIEIHYRPSWMYDPFKNKRLQEFFTDNAHKQFTNITETAEGEFPTPTNAFNRIYILLHIYRHLFQEGIGLRQTLDYYFVLSNTIPSEERQETTKHLKHFGVYKFASALMYVLHKTFKLDKEKMIAKPNAKRGEFLLNEIMTAGNFGKHDKRYDFVNKENEFRHFMNSMRRINRLTVQYTRETLWSPYFKTWHWFWRRKHK